MVRQMDIRVQMKWTRDSDFWFGPSIGTPIFGWFNVQQARHTPGVFGVWRKDCCITALIAEFRYREYICALCGIVNTPYPT